MVEVKEELLCDEVVSVAKVEVSSWRDAAVEEGTWGCFATTDGDDPANRKRVGKNVRKCAQNMTKITHIFTLERSKFNVTCQFFA